MLFPHYLIQCYNTPTIIIFMHISQKLRLFTCTHTFRIITQTFCIKRHPQTIFALSSGVNTAISIVRVSGPESFRVLELLQPKFQQPLCKQALFSKYKVKPREMMLKSIFGLTKGLIDRCLLVFFEANHSYSGEDLFQLHLHGSRAVVLAVFQEFKRFQFRMAKRGQFTRRAVLNGLMNLQQAEAINDLVQSELQFERQVAINNILGKTSNFLSQIRSELIEALALLQAYIEFEQNEADETLIEKSKEKIDKIQQKLRKVIDSSKSFQTAKEGIKVSIVGRPNVGKSTLINAMAKKDVAIVSPIPGTTRDLIQSSIELQGYKLHLVDTAGVRESDCPIEKEGIRRSRTSAADSHLIIVMLDLSTSAYSETASQIIIEPHPDEIKLITQSKAIIALNKTDKLSEAQSKKQVLIRSDPPIKVQLCLSLKKQEGLQHLLQVIGNRLNKSFKLYEGQSSQIFFTRARYLDGLQRCCQQLHLCLYQQYADLMSAHLRNGMRQIEELTGRIDCEQVLDSIFSTFCIGK